MADHRAPEMNHQLDFCLATEEDYEGVMAISGDVYKGVDYLPVRYHSWLQDTKRRTFVAKRQGKVVAFESICLVDDGSTAVPEGLRVAPGERGRGVAGLIQNFAKGYIKNEFPAVKYIRLSRVEDPPPSMLSQYRLLQVKAALSLIFKVEEIEKTVYHFITKLEKEGQRFQPPVALELEDVRRIYTNEKVIEKLLPAKMLIQGWLPVLPITSNLDYLRAKVVSWMADSTDEPNFLSLGSHPFKVPFGDNAYRFDINLFGTEPRCAKIHLLAQLLVGANITSGSVLCCCLYMEKEVFQTLDMFCEGIKKYDFWMEQIVMEKDI
ncbi:histidine N-acetyltransferase-like [Lissotriton helveticus]